MRRRSRHLQRKTKLDQLEQTDTYSVRLGSVVVYVLDIEYEQQRVKEHIVGGHECRDEEERGDLLVHFMRFHRLGNFTFFEILQKIKT